MGLAGFSLGHMLVVLLVVVLVFGTKRLGSLGSDLGEAIKGFRKAMGSESEGDAPGQNQSSLQVNKEKEKHV